MFYEGNIYVAKDGDTPVKMLLNKANRHGMIAGATGTGKTITLKVLAESFSDAGVPVFLADVKGDLAGMCRQGEATENLQKRIEKFGLAETGFHYQAYPTTFWDIYGKNGLPLRTTVSEMGPTLLARLMDLTPTQEDILNIIFRIADDEGLLLLDSKDLRSMLAYVAENSKDYSDQYGNMSKASINVIQRGAAALDAEGAEMFLGEPALNIRDWIRLDTNGKGMINVLDSQSLINSPKMYATFLLWMLSELFEIMPEVGDLDKPRMVFFFDEAHLLFKDAPKALLAKIEQVVKLIRSKGIGVYFITQNPRDIPDSVLSQLGNKIQHALHAYSPAEQKGIKAAADSFRPNPAFKTAEVIQELGIGEALVSFIQEDGTPSMVQRAKILPPQSLMGSISDAEREQEIRSNFLAVQYSDAIDRDSAYEFLQRKRIQDEADAEEERARIAAEKAAEKERIAVEKAEEKARIAAEKAEEKARIAAEKAEEREKAAAERRKKAAVKGVASSAAGTVGRELGKTVGGTVGGKFGKTLGGNIGASLGRGILGNLFGR